MAAGLRTDLAELLRSAPPLDAAPIARAGPTRPFGPRPPSRPAPTPRPSPLRWALVLAAIPMVAGASWSVRTTPSVRRCDGVPPPMTPGAQVVEGDTSGAGCVSVGVYADQVLTIRVDPSDPTPRRFAIGQPGDRITLGDWDCDGRSTVALERPSTGETLYYDDWRTTAPSSVTRCSQSIR